MNKKAPIILKDKSFFDGNKVAPTWYELRNVFCTCF